MITIKYFRESPLRRRVDHFSNSLEVAETRVETKMETKMETRVEPKMETKMEPAVEMQEIRSADKLVLSRQKRRRVKRKRLGTKHFGRTELAASRSGKGFHSEKKRRTKPPRPTGLPPHMKVK